MLLLLSPFGCTRWDGQLDPSSAFEAVREDAEGDSDSDSDSDADGDSDGGSYDDADADADALVGLIASVDGWLELALTDVQNGGVSVEAFVDTESLCWEQADMDNVELRVWVSVAAGHLYQFQIHGTQGATRWTPTLTEHAVVDALEPDTERSEATLVSSAASAYFHAGAVAGGIDYDDYDDWYRYESDGSAFELRVSEVADDVQVGVELFGPALPDEMIASAYADDMGDDLYFRSAQRQSGTWYLRTKAAWVDHSGCLKGAAPDSLSQPYTLSIGDL